MKHKNNKKWRFDILKWFENQYWVDFPFFFKYIWHVIEELFSSYLRVG